MKYVKNLRKRKLATKTTLVCMPMIQIKKVLNKKHITVNNNNKKIIMNILLINLVLIMLKENALT